MASFASITLDFGQVNSGAQFSLQIKGQTQQFLALDSVSVGNTTTLGDRWIYVEGNESVPANSFATMFQTNIDALGYDDIVVSSTNGGQVTISYTTYSDTNNFGATQGSQVPWSNQVSSDIFVLLLSDNDSPTCNTILDVPTVLEAACGQSNGSITVNVITSANVVEYSIDGVNYQDDSLFTNLSSGNYTVYVRDKFIVDCIVTQEVTVPSDSCCTLELESYTITKGTTTGKKLTIYAKATGNVEYGISVLNNIFLGDFQPSNVFDDIEPQTVTVYYREVIAGQVICTNTFQIEIPDIISRSYNNLLNISYSEVSNSWVSRHTFYPIKMFNIFDKMYSFSLIENTNYIWKHNEDNWCKYYDDQKTFEIQFIVNDQLSVQKILHNLKVISNNVMPMEIHYESDNDNETSNEGETDFRRTIVQPIYDLRKEGRIKGNADYKENHLYVQVNKNKQKRIRDKYIKIRIVYKGDKYTIISAIQSMFTISYS